MKTQKSVVLALCLSTAALLPSSARAADWYHTPESPFITREGEEVHTIELASLPVANAQQALTAARKSQPDAVIVLKLSGELVVSDAPLKIGSRTCVMLGEGARFTASETARAEALLSVEAGEFVSLAGAGRDLAALDGAGRVAVGIKVAQSGKVHIDRVAVSRCRQAGIDYEGRGADRFSDAGSVTRCRIADCAGAGVHIRNAAQFVCVDNELLGNGPCGIRIDSASSVVAGNVCRGSAIGIEAGSTNGAAARNVLIGNGVGLALLAQSSINFISYNRIAGNDLGIRVAGEKNSIYCNDLDNTKELECAGAGNVIAGHRDLVGAEVEPGGNSYFNPPTFTNNHTDSVIVNGLGRHDIEIKGGAGRTFHHSKPVPEPADLAIAQQAIDQARQEHPNDVIVAHLKGLYTATKSTGLSIPANVCVIVYGSIKAQGDAIDWHTLPKETQRDTQVIKMASKGFVSLSGGIIDGRFLPYHVVNAPGQNVAIIDGVTVKASGFNGITTKHHGGLGRPIFIRSCTVVDCAGRGLWAHVSRDAHLIDNVCSGNIADGLDIDAYCMDSTALFNVCTGNRRHGIFVEEGVKRNIVFGNLFADNHDCGIAVWNEAVKGNTSFNSLVCNRCPRNGIGLAVGGRSAEKTSNTNFFFNNRCTESRRAGLRYGNRHSAGNYFAQHVVRRNTRAIENYTKQPMTLYFAAP